MGRTRRSRSDLEHALQKIDYELKPIDIVLIWTGATQSSDRAEYFEQPGMTRASTLWLVEKGIKVIGVDTYGFDRKFRRWRGFKRTGDGKHDLAGALRRDRPPYCQIEKLANLDAIPRPHSFKVSCFPIKVSAPAPGGLDRSHSSELGSVGQSGVG